MRRQEWRIVAPLVSSAEERTGSAGSDDTDIVTEDHSPEQPMPLDDVWLPAPIAPGDRDSGGPSDC